MDGSESAHPSDPRATVKVGFRLGGEDFVEPGFHIRDERIGFFQIDRAAFFRIG